MAVLGVITCEILEQEFAYLLSIDPEVTGVTVVEDASSSEFIETLESMGRFSPRRIPLMRGFSPNFSGELEVVVRVLELALHNKKRFLQDGLTKAAKEMGRYVDGIVLGYGLCGNALQKPEELLRDVGVPIFIPMDQDHPVDDCVGLIIGGRECYYGEQCREAGTFFMIPGWTRHWKRLFEKEYGTYDMKIAKRILSGYKRSLLIPTSVLSEEEMRKNIEEFSEMFQFRTEVLPGTLEMLNKTWEEAKKSTFGSSESE